MFEKLVLLRKNADFVEKYSTCADSTLEAKKVQSFVDSFFDEVEDEDDFPPADL